MTNSAPHPGIDFPFTVWKIVNMERKLDDLGTVYIVHYAVTRYKDGEQVGAYGSVGLEAPEADGIPYAQLTEDVVVDWVQQKLGGNEKVAELEAALDIKIAEKLTPSKGTGLPWG